MNPIRVLLADEHPIVGAGTHILETARHLFEDLAPDILLIEMTLHNGQEPPSVQQATSASPQVFVLRGYHNRVYVFGLVTSEPDPGLTEHNALQTITEAIQAGLDGAVGERGRRIVAKLPTPQLEGAHERLPKLTARERDVLRQLATGKSDQAIGEHLHISTSTVRYHLRHIYRKLGVKQRSEAVLWAVRAGLAEEVL